MPPVPKSAGGRKLFGLPRTWALAAIGVGVALVAWYWYKSRSGSGASAQAALPASSDMSGADQGTAAPSLGGTPDSGTGASTLTGDQLVSAFAAEQNALLGGFQSQQQLISQLSGGYEQLAMTSEQQLGALAGALIGLIPKPGSTTAASTTGTGATAKTVTPPGTTSYDVKTGTTTTGGGVTIPPVVQYSSGGKGKQIQGPSIFAFK